MKLLSKEELKKAHGETRMMVCFHLHADTPGVSGDKTGSDPIQESHTRGGGAPEGRRTPILGRKEIVEMGQGSDQRRSFLAASG